MITLYIFTAVIVAFVLVSLTYASYLFRRAKELAPYYAQKAELEQAIQTAHQTLSQVRQELDSKSSELAQAKLDIADGEKNREWLQNNQNTVSSLKIQIDNAQQELANVNQKLNTRKEELQQTEGELRDRTAELKETEIAKDNAKRDLARVQSDLNAEKTRYKTLEESNAKHEEKQNELMQSCARLEVEKSELESRKTALDGTVEEKKKELSELERSIRDQQEGQGKLLNEIDALKRQKAEKEKDVEKQDMQIKDLEDKRNDLRMEILTMEQRLGKWKVEKESEKHQWQDLDKEIKTINITNPQKYEEREWLNEFEQNLKSCHFRFDPRLIRAFHTSLKVADCSPMVVLSGISGTGKSLLPELYAHAIGMNFLQVPVQPRWDSSQDMLGFYNYMERRYKATELSRLLWQTDQYNNEKEAKKHPAMNMILLDEMNLARVEYYFSDMLSKLEVRRGLNPGVEEKRRAAEIVLESGATGGADSLRRIFIGTHNLFVGTMNEDESTQSLSDKVKDRANVLRFGRPKQLNGATADKDAFFKKYKNRMMTEASWKEWRNTPAATFSDLGKIMEAMNTRLAALSRPFAHRMWNTVDSYIRQYPGEFKDALTDQIEMKLLPKLNGLDLTDQKTRQGMDALENELRCTVNGELADAFAAACEQEFFIWRGIQR